MNQTYTVVDTDRWYATWLELTKNIWTPHHITQSLRVFTQYAYLLRKGFRETYLVTWGNVLFQQVLPSNIIRAQVQIIADQILKEYWTNLKYLQIFVLASGGFVFGKMLFDALTKISPENLPRFFSIRTKSYEKGGGRSERGVEIDENSASHVDFGLHWDGINPQYYSRWLLYNEQLLRKAPALVLDDVLDTWHTILAVRQALWEIFDPDKIGTAFLVEKPDGLELPQDPRSPWAFNTSGIIVLGKPWLA